MHHPLFRCLIGVLLGGRWSDHMLKKRRFFIEGQKAAHCLRLDLLHVDHGGELL